jgi:hypothetical protein
MLQLGKNYREHLTREKIDELIAAASARPVVATT